MAAASHSSYKRSRNQTVQNNYHSIAAKLITEIIHKATLIVHWGLTWVFTFNIVGNPRFIHFTLGVGYMGFWVVMT